MRKLVLCFFKYFMKHKKANIAIELVFLLPIMLCVVCAIIEYALIFTLSANVQAASYMAARNVISGNLYGTNPNSGETNAEVRTRMIKNTIEKKLGFYKKFLDDKDKDLVIFIRKLNTTQNAFSNNYTQIIQEIKTCMNNFDGCNSSALISDNQAGDSFLLVLVGFKWRYQTPFVGLLESSSNDEYMWISSLSGNMIEG